jgi:serine protease AprX
MLQANPSLTPDQVKWLLMNTARPYQGQLPLTPGIVNGASAVNYTLGSGARAPGTANLGLLPSASYNAITGQITNSSSYWANSYWANSCCL